MQIGKWLFGKKALEIRGIKIINQMMSQQRGGGGRGGGLQGLNGLAPLSPNKNARSGATRGGDTRGYRVCFRGIKSARLAVLTPPLANGSLQRCDNDLCKGIRLTLSGPGVHSQCASPPFLCVCACV